VSVEIIPVTGLPEFGVADDLPAILSRVLSGIGVRSRDVIAVTQKVVSKVEDRVVREADGGKEAWVRRESVRVLAQRGDLVIAETRHGFICANAGVDASNVPEGMLALLPEDPDASADAIRKRILARCNAKVGVVITDTFGRPWREGVTNVAIGCSGIPALVDLRGTRDANGRLLDATVVAFADEVAAASGLVMGKSDGVPAAIIRGLKPAGPEGRSTDLVRAPGEDLFRESPLGAISGRRTIRTFGGDAVPREAIEEAVRAACTAPAPHHTQPWTFVALRPGPGRERLLAAMERAWRLDLQGDGLDPGTVEGRIARSKALLGSAPWLVIPAIRLAGAHPYPDPERLGAERQMFLLSAGAAIENFLLAIHAQGLGGAWVSSTLFCKEETRHALGLQDEWMPMGAIAVGTPGGERPPQRAPLRLDAFLRVIDN